MRHLIVARHQEPLPWLAWLHACSEVWAVTVVSNGVHRPNVGREAGAYMWWLLDNYDRLQPDDLYAFVQADPFPHCAQIMERLHDTPEGWVALGDQLYESDALGLPHHAGLPVALRHDQLLDDEFPGNVWFHGGGQFLCRGSVLLSRPREFYVQLAEIADDEATGGPWVLERLWACLFADVREVAAT